MELLLAVIVAGLVSIDPIGPAILFKGMSDGVPRPNLVTFTVATCAAMLAAGVALAAVSMVVIDVVTVSPSQNEAIEAALKIGLAVVLVFWLLYSGLTGGGHRAEPHEAKADAGLLHGSASRVSGTGAAFGMAALLNPVLVALAVTLAATESLLAVLAGLTIWTLIAECLLVGLLAAYLMGAHERAVQTVRRWQVRHRTAIWVVLYTAAAVVAVLLAADGIGYFASSR